MSILTGLKEKVEFLKGFDAEIKTRKQGVNKFSKSVALTDAKALLEEYKAKAEIEKDVEILEGLKKEFLKPNVLGELATELEKETRYAVEVTQEIRRKCEEAKAQYENTLKALNEEHYKLMTEIEDKRREYEDVCCSLGHDWHEVRGKLHIHNSSSPAEFVSRESINL